MNQIILIRHCEAEGQNPEDPLTRQGERQSEILRDFLSHLPIDLVAASEYRRAGQTAKPLADTLGLEVQVDARLNERALSETPIANWREVLRDSFSDPDLRGPGGESAREVLGRAWAGLNDVLRTGCHLPTVVTHGNLLSLVLHSLDAAFGYEGWERLSNPDVYLLESAEPGRFTFRRIWNASNAEE